MIPTAAQLETIARSRNGQLSSVPFPLLLHAFAAHRRMAVLKLRRGQICKEIVLEDGVPVECLSNLVHETLGAVLVDRGTLDEATAHTCLRVATSRRMKLGELLVERGIVSSAELYRILQQNLARKLLDGFTWADGEYNVSFDVPEVDSPLRVNVAQLVVVGITRFTPKELIESSVTPLMTSKIALNPNPYYRTSEIRLSNGHRRVTEALQHKPQTAQELTATCDLHFDELQRLLCALAVIGHIVPAQQLNGATAAAARTRRQQRPRGPATSPAEQRLTSEELARLFLAHRNRDPFDLLGIDASAHIDAVEAAYISLAERLCPSRYAGDEHDQASSVLLAVARSYAELSDPSGRTRAEDRRRRRRPETPTKELPTPGPDGTKPLDSRIVYSDARQLMETGDLQQAMDRLTEAVDMNPQNGTYRAELAWCHFKSNTALNARPALDALIEATRIDPSCGLAHHYLGEIYRQFEHLEEAEASYRLAIQLMAPDQRPVEALEELQRTLEQRRSG